MFFSMWSSLLIMFISIIVMSLSFIISKKSTIDQEKLSPFECGFNPSISPRVPFSLRFFLIAMIFLIFDVEIVLLLPLPMSYMNPPLILMTSLSFIIILSLGLYHEWNKGVLNWAS